MKISLNWLQDYIDVSGYSARQIGDTLSDRGFPIESIETVGDDTVLDVELTSNRGDCLGHIGIARELSAAYGRPLRLPSVELPQSDRHISEFVDVQIDEPALCGRYTAAVIEGVRVGPSPDWVQKRLNAVGVRSVNNVVDATNYAMMEHGQPPHAFDYDTLQGKKIIVRKALAGEQLVSIDGSKCQLSNAMLVIADAKVPVAVAGVMGGLATEVSEKTTTVLLEEAHFDPVCIRRTSRTLSLKSEASYRFERIVDAENIEWASCRCAQLIIQFAGGKAVQGIADVFPAKKEPLTVGVRLSRIEHLLGVSISKDQLMDIYTRLGLAPEVKADNLIVCTVPSWRHDIYREADLIEEAIRCRGYDTIPVQDKISIRVAVEDKRESCANQIRSLLTGCGLFEAITVSFVDADLAAVFSDIPADQLLAVQDVNQKSTRILRPTLLGSLASVLRSNYNAGNQACRFFELADTFCPVQGSALPLERTCVGIVADNGFADTKGYIEAIARMFNSSLVLSFKPACCRWASAGADIFWGGEKIGYAGVLKSELAKKLDLDKTPQVCFAELDFDILCRQAVPVAAVKPIPRFPAICRDLSLIVGEPVTWEQVVSVVGQNAPAELEHTDFVALYRGKPIAAGQKSLTLSLRFRDDEGTLRHEQVDGFERQILGALKAQLNAQIRTA